MAERWQKNSSDQCTAWKRVGNLGYQGSGTTNFNVPTAGLAAATNGVSSGSTLEFLVIDPVSGNHAMSALAVGG
ncbi:MAG: hypothetical protein RLY93_15055 [Sumerlaeia bacterium]